MSNHPTRRRALIAAVPAGLALAWVPAGVLAQADGALKLVVPFPAGGTADVLPRLLAEKLRPRFPAGVVVENKVGAGGNIGAEQVFNAAPDGTTLLVSPPGPIAINHNLYRKLAFDPTQWVPVTVIATVPNVLAVSTRLPVRTLGEFLDHLKANPGKVNVASQGYGSTSHLTAAMFMQVTGTEMTHVPYKGTAPALIDLIGGNVDVFFDNLSSSAQHHVGGKLRILAVADEQRSAALPDVGTFAEAGIDGMNAVTFFSVVAPPGTPKATVASLHEAFADALAQPDVRRKFADQGAEPRGWPPDRTASFIGAETEKWKKVIKSANVTLD
jgi:tripartite-type tricarboxylate transporter receptor subunit TctC